MFTPEECHNLAREYDTKSKWMEGHPRSYYAAKKLGVYKSCTSHMRSGNQKWTETACIKDALNYKTKTKWKEANNSAYSAARNNGWFQACTNHMRNPKVKYTLEDVLNRVAKFKTWTQWKSEDKGSYIAAQRNGWLENAADLLERPKPHPNRFIKWTEEKILSEAKNFKNKKAWAISSPSSYNAARAMGVFEKATAHMSDPRLKRHE